MFVEMLVCITSHPCDRSMADSGRSPLHGAAWHGIREVFVHSNSIEELNGGFETVTAGKKTTTPHDMTKCYYRVLSTIGSSYNPRSSEQFNTLRQ